jgi:hypothetical protein
MVPDGEQLRRFKSRLNVMSQLVSTIGYVDVGHPKGELPERPVSSGASSGPRGSGRPTSTTTSPR